MPLRYFWYGIVPFVAYIVVMIQIGKSGLSFLKRNRYVAVFVVTVWYGIFESFANYEALTKSSNPLHYVMKIKDGSVIKTGKDWAYAGRTKDYWFVYNIKNKFTRAIKNDEIEVIDFDSKNK